MRSTPARHGSESKTGSPRTSSGRRIRLPRHAHVLGGLVKRHQPRGNLITDVQLAALAIEHGLEVCSADTDFARFTEIRWCNPLAS